MYCVQDVSERLGEQMEYLCRITQVSTLTSLLPVTDTSERSTLTTSLCTVFNTPASISRARTATALGQLVCYLGLSDHPSSPGWQRPKGARRDHSLLPERDGHDEHGNVAIVASLLACGHDPSKLGLHRNMGWAIVIGRAFAVALIDHGATVDSSLPAFHADPHRGAKHSRTMEATSQWQLQGCSSLLLNYSGDCTIVLRGA